MSNYWYYQIIIIVIIILFLIGRPEQAINVQVNCVDFINEELALVTWYPGSDNYAPIMEYMVEYSTQFERETWYPAEIFNLTGLVQSTSVKVSFWLLKQRNIQC